MSDWNHIGGGGDASIIGDNGNIVIITDNRGEDSGVAITDVELKTNKVTEFQTTPTDINYPSEKLVKDSLDTKMDKLPLATENNVIIFDEFGNAKDSGFPASKLDPIIDDRVATFANLPPASEHNEEIWLVTTTTGTIYINRKVAGLYISNGTEWSLTTPLDIDGYQKLITTPTNNNLVKTDGNGQAQDAGVAVSIDGNMTSNSDAKLPTEKAVRTFLAKTETTVTKYVSDINSSDSNNGNTRFTPYLTVAKAWTDITPSGSVNVLGAGTYNVSHTFASSKQSIKTILESGTKITGTIGLVSGNTSMQFFGGKIQATITDASLGTVYFNNVDLSGSMLTFSGGGYKQITNSSSTPTMITLSNLASGTGTLELNNVIGGIVGISVGTGWTVIYRNTIIATIGAVNGIVVEANNTFCNAMLASQSQLNAISADGYYILNFANPTITGVTVAKGDVIYKAGSTILCVYKFSFAPTTFAVLNPSNPAQRFTWAKSIDGWIQLGSINTTNLQSTNTVYIDSTYGSDANDGLSEYTKVATLQHALSIASSLWTINVVGNNTVTYSGNITNNVTIQLSPNTTLASQTSNVTNITFAYTQNVITATRSGHGIQVGDAIEFTGQSGNNSVLTGKWLVTNTDTNTFTFKLNSVPAGALSQTNGTRHQQINVINGAKFTGGNITATINDTSSQPVSFYETSLANAVIRHAGSGSKQYSGISNLPRVVATANGIGNIYFSVNNFSHLRLDITGGWTIAHSGMSVRASTDNNEIYDNKNLICTAILSNQTDVNNVNTDGHYAVNFDGGNFGSLSNVIAKKGAILYYQQGVWLLAEPEKSTVASILVGTSTWIKVNATWVQPSPSLISTITSGDANTITETGLYIWNSGTNTPFPDGILNVYKRNDLRIVQDFYYAGSSTDQGSQSYNRISFGSSLTWADWNLNVVHAGGLMAANRLLASNGAGTRALSTDITPDNVAQFTTSTSNTLTDYPIGSVILAQDYNAVGPARNSSSTVKYHPTQNYNFVFAGEPGTTLLGTWRARGRNQATNAPVIFQRTA